MAHSPFLYEIVDDVNNLYTARHNYSFIQSIFYINMAVQKEKISLINKQYEHNKTVVKFFADCITKNVNARRDIMTLRRHINIMPSLYRLIKINLHRIYSR